MGMADDEVSETEDVGDLWLTFWVSAVLAGLAAFGLLRFMGLASWAMVSAIAAGLVIGWIVSGVRPARRFVSHVVQLFAFPWW
jgi:hypothetical protein